jgi:hypothetical protein
MSVVNRARRERYSNIAAGSATGPERTIAGDTVSRKELHGGGYCTSTSTGDAWHSNVGVGSSVSEQQTMAAVGGEMPENIVVAATTNTNERPASDA